MRSMEELFYALLQDVYFAEKQLVKSLPKLAKTVRMKNCRRHS